MDSRNCKSVLSSALSEILLPLGFKKERGGWNRYLDDVFQRVELEKTRIAWEPRWGIDINKLLQSHQDHKACQMHFQWDFIHVMTLKGRQDSLFHEYLNSTNLDSGMDSQKRFELISKYSKVYLVPCLEALKTIESLRQMEDDRSHPYRAIMFHPSLPDKF